jgi:anaphase-promoting complex subunit 4
MEGQSFTQLLDRGISVDVVLAEWCPTMDLLALVTADNQLHVHRLNWQRLWWTSPEATVTGARHRRLFPCRGGCIFLPS